MLTEAMAGLVSAGGTALVTAMVTEGWESVRARCARLLCRGDVKRAAADERELEQSRAAPAGLSDAGLIEQHATAWGQARQAVQGQGVQNVTFGGQNGGPSTPPGCPR
jgi:hypothetical protein